CRGASRRSLAAAVRSWLPPPPRRSGRRWPQAWSGAGWLGCLRVWRGAGGEREAGQHVAQFADVAGPRARSQVGDGRRGDFAIRIDGVEQMLDDGVEVAAVLQPGQRHLEGVEAIEQVGAKASVENGAVERG